MKDLRKSFSKFWYNILNKIIFKNIYEKIDANTEFQKNTIQYNEKKFTAIKEILEKTDLENKNFIKQHQTQNTEFIREIAQKNSKIVLEQNTNFVKEISSLHQQHREDIKNHVFKQNRQQKIEFIKENKEFVKEIKEYASSILEQNRQQNTEFIKEAENQYKNQSLDIIAQNKTFFENFIKFSEKQYKQENANIMIKNERQTTMLNKKVLADIKKDVLQQNTIQNKEYLKQNREQITETVTKIIEQNNSEIQKFIKFITEITQQNRKEDKSFILENNETMKKLNTEFFKNSKHQHLEISRDFLSKSSTQFKNMINNATISNKQENSLLLQNFVTENKNQYNEFIKMISIQIDEKNSTFIKQNTNLIKELLEQSLISQGTVKQKYSELIIYQILSAFRKDCLIIKNSLIVLEKMDASEIKVARNLSAQYQKNQHKIPILDMTRGLIVIKLLFPPFFLQMYNNLDILKNYLDHTTYSEIIQTIEKCESFFKVYKNHKKIDEINKNLESHISTLDKLLVKLVTN